MRFSRKRICFLLFMIAMVLAICISILDDKLYVRYDSLVVFSFVLNIAVFFVKYIGAINKHSFSFDMMFWLFNLMFFGIAPLLQYLTNTYSWGLQPENNEIVKANIFILLFSIVYIFAHGVSLVKKNVKGRDRKRDVHYSINRVCLNVMTFITVLMALYFLIFIGFRNIFNRELVDKALGKNVDGTMMGLIVSHVFRNVPLFTTVVAFMDVKRKKKLTFSFVIAVLCLLITSFPTGLSRNMMASFYAGLMIIMFEKFRKGRFFSLVILFGLVLIFPLANVFRYSLSGESTGFFELISLSIKNTYLEAHYDAHQMFITIIRYVDQFGYSWGNQLLGAVFFFVPRSVWPTKPVGTGSMAVTELKQFSFTNVSAPFMAEAYINFGVLGIVLFAILLSKIVKILDAMYWKETQRYSTIRIVYPFAMFMFFFVCRGDLLSSWAYTFAQLSIGTLICKFVIRKTKKS